MPVPFDVPAGTPSIEVRLSYDTSAGVLDLGCEDPSRWRGWSGGARSRYVITEDSATPGYLPGVVEPGEWHVILGIHQLPAEGLDVILEIDVPATGPVETEPRAAVEQGPPRGSTRNLPAPAGMRWYAGDFHAHTLHSDGSESIDQLAARAVRSGLDFLAVTDHNTTSHHAHLPGVGARHSVTLLPGQEVTTSRGHANALGDIGWIDFRRPANTWVSEVAARGGVLSVNHAVDGDCSWQHPLAMLPRAIELWHISWYRNLAASFPFAFLARWGSGVVPIGGSDFHNPSEGYTLGTPTTWVCAEANSPEAILAGVAAGRTAISGTMRADATPELIEAPILLRLGSDLVAIAAEGSVLVDIEGARRRITGPSVTIPESWGTGPFHLEGADRRVLAICA